MNPPPFYIDNKEKYYKASKHIEWRSDPGIPSFIEAATLYFSVAESKSISGDCFFCYSVIP